MSAPVYVARAANVAARMIGGEMMIMSGRDSSLFSLNATASAIWQAADGVTPLAALVEAHICTAYEVDRDGRCRMRKKWSATWRAMEYFGCPTRR